VKTKRIETRWAAIIDQVKSWGMRLPRAGEGSGPRVLVFRQGSTADALVGVLWQESGEFVFKYDPQYASTKGAEPISAFPDLEEEYRSKELWPFFAVRIPPRDRQDVREALAKLSLRPEQTLEVLGKLARRTISNPYTLKFAEAA